MSPFANPIFLLRILKRYLVDIDRLQKISNEQLRTFQDKQLRRIVHFAYTVPMYHHLYRKATVHPSDIKGIADITKLPVISKNDFQQYTQDEKRSRTIPEKNLINVATSGTSGKQLSLYVDWFDIIMGLFGYLRVLRTHGINWRKDRISIIGDFAPHTAESGYIHRGINTQIIQRFVKNNFQWLDTNDNPKTIIQQLNTFQPTFIGGYVGMLGHLALLKENGYGEQIQPQLIASTGAVLDPTLKEYIEKTVQAPVVEAYGATETGPIAYQCKSEYYHVMSDLVYLEIQQNGQQVASKKPGHLIVTKLYGQGTPFIRYASVNDIVAPFYEPCTCGLAGEHLYRIYGRDDLALYFPHGRAMLPATISTIFSKLLYQLKTNKLKDVKITQTTPTELSIDCLIDPQYHDQPPTVEEILAFIKKEFQQKLGSAIQIKIQEVKEIPKKGPRISSKIDQKNIDIKEYI